MYKIGEIVYHDELYFRDGNKDEKNNRPCIVIYNNEVEEYVLTIPLTSKVETFNKKNYNYYFIPDIIYNYRKLSFVKLDNINKETYNNTHTTGQYINDEQIEKILHKIEININNKEYKDLINLIIESINNTKKQEEKEEEKQRKLERKLRRQLAKSTNILNED